MNLKTLTLTALQALGSERVILVEHRPNYPYQNGVKLEKQEGTAVSVALPARRFERIVVKISQDAVPISNEELDKRNLAGRYVFCSFSNFSASMYQDFDSKSKEVKISARADSMELVQEVKA